MRRNVLAAIGAHNAQVFDAYAGPGEMWSAVWREAAHYTGCDEGMVQRRTQGVRC